jgi:tetratricopeptide (TPR) repeat protein
MFRITSLTEISDRQLDRLLRRIAAILLIGLIAFVGFYVVDRWRVPATPMIDQRTASLEAAVRADPADIASRGQLADLYTAAARYPEAIAQYDAILGTGKEDELAHFGRGTALRASGDLAGAIVDFQAVVDIAKGGEMAHVDPMLNAAYFGLGAIALEQGRPKDAVAHLLAAVEIKRSDADALNLLGSAYLKAGEPAKAIEPLKRAIAFVPLGWTEPYTTLARAYQATGDPARSEWAGAMADLSSGDAMGAKARLLAISDGDAALEAAIGLGLVSETLGDDAAAADWYGKALAIDPANAEARLGVGRVSTPDVTTTPLPDLPKPGQLEGGQGS